MSLRFRLTLYYSFFVALVLVLVALAVYTLTERSLIGSLEARTEAMMEGVLERSDVRIGAQTLTSDAYYLAYIYLFQPIEEPADLRRGVLNTADQLARAPVHQNPTADNLFNYLSDETYRTAFEQGGAFQQLRLPEGGGRWVAYVRRHGVARDPVNYEALSLVALPVPTGTLASLRTLLIQTIFFAFIAFTIGVWLLSSKVLMPVKRVTDATALITEQDLSQRVPVPKTHDELEELAVTLNHMLDRLQESFETQRRFTADASHELRTPVTAIVGHANYLLRRTKPSPEQVDSLTVIRREAERMAKLVNDLLELARADAGFLIQREPMNLVEVIESVHMEIAPVAGSAQISVSAGQPLIEVLGDAGRLKQVVLNLVQNALNAGARHISLSLTREKGSVRLEVLDDGPGIPAEAIPHLFDRFYRVDGARSARGNGSGLGLAIVRWIVEQHDGSVSVESRLGEGSVFTVLLPALNPKQTEQVLRGQAQPSAKPQVKSRGKPVL